MQSRKPLSLGVLAGLLAIASCQNGSSPDAAAGPPVDIRVSAGDGQQGRAGTVLNAPIAAKVTDAKGRGVPNVQVIFQPSVGSGSVESPLARTNGAGVATTQWTMPTRAGLPATLRALLLDSLTGALIDTARFNATVGAGLPTSMQMSSAPQRAASGSTITTLAVLLRDAYGNGSAGVVVNWAVAQGGGTVSAPTSVTDANGVAAISYTLGTTAGTNRLTASAGTLTGFFSIESVVPGTPARIFPLPSPTYAPLGESVALSVRVLDGLDLGVAGQTVTWSRIAGAGQLSAATSVTDQNGMATITYTLGSVTGANTIQAALGSLTASFSIEGRNIPRRLATLGRPAFGVGRTSDGRFVTTLINNGEVDTFAESAPGTRQTITVGGTPVVVALDPAGAFAYVSNMSGWVDVIDLHTNSIAMKVPVPGAHSLTMSPAGDKVYVASYEGTVYALSTTTRAIVGSVAVANGPWGIAFRTSATDTLMYVTARDGGSITEVDTKTMSVLRTFNIGGRPHGLVISPDGLTLYVADNGQGLVKAVSTSNGTVTRIASLSGAFGIAISPDGSTLYATTDNAQAAVITASTLAITRLYETVAEDRQIIVAPDGATAWAASMGGWIDILPR